MKEKLWWKKYLNYKNKENIKMKKEKKKSKYQYEHGMQFLEVY